MKRLLLLSFVLSGTLGVTAQVQNGPKYKPATNEIIQSPLANRLKTLDAKTLTSNVDMFKGSNSALVAKKKRAAGVGTLIGKTYYDLQTNGSSQPRIQTWGSNIVGCTWTMDPNAGDDAFPSRGTGYQYKDPSGNWLSIPTARLESIRTGFSSYLITAGNKETVLCHDGALSNLVHSTRSAGTGAWTQSITKFPNDALSKAIWPHAASTGNYVYVVDAGTDTLIKANTIIRGHYWSKSTDGGATFSVDHVPFPGLDSLDLFYASADNYSVDAKDDSIVAVLFGSDNQYGSTVLFKSTDYGQSWTRTDLNRSNYPGVGINSYGSNMIDYYDNTTGATGADGITDTFDVDDGGVEVLIDNNNKVHCFWSHKRAINAGSGLSIYPTMEILHYMEGNNSIDIMENVFLFRNDRDGDGNINIGDKSLIPGVTGKSDDANYGNYGYLGQLSSTVDANNNIYVFYSMIVDNDTTVLGPKIGTAGVEGQGFRDIYVSVLKNGDTNFVISATGPQFSVNVTKSNGIEESWPSVPKRVSTNKIPLIFHSDPEPGIFLAEDNAMTENEVRYMELTTDNILTQIADSTNMSQNVFLSINDVKNNTIGKIYPNPTANEFYVLLKNGKNENANIVVTNVLGSVVSKFSAKPIDGLIKINTESLTPGNYFVQVENSYGKDAHKFTIVK